jgi:hypothetical protein
MSKILVDCGRLGIRTKQPKGYGRALARSDFESQPRRESMRRKWHSDWREAKLFCDRLAPLIRYLESQVGRPWNHVYRDICRHAHRDTTLGRHLRIHVAEQVALKVEIDPRTRMPRARDRSWRLYAFYVHPRTGLLCRTPERR